MPPFRGLKHQETSDTPSLFSPSPFYTLVMRVSSLVMTLYYRLLSPVVDRIDHEMPDASDPPHTCDSNVVLVPH